MVHESQMQKAEINIRKTYKSNQDLANNNNIYSNNIFTCLVIDKNYLD